MRPTRRASDTVTILVLTMVLAAGPALLAPATGHASAPPAPRAAAAASSAPLAGPAVVAPAVAAPSTGRVVTNTVSAPPTGALNGYAAVDNATQTLYSVSSGFYDLYGPETDILDRFNLTTGAPIGDPVLLADPAVAVATQMVLDPVHSLLYVGFDNLSGGGGPGWILVLNATSLDPVANLSVFLGDPTFEPYFLLWDPASDQVFAENSTTVEVAIINTTTNDVTTVIPFPCTSCDPVGFIDVWTNEYVLLPTGTPELDAINTTEDLAAVGIDFSGTDPSFESGVGGYDNVTGYIYVSNQSGVGDVQVFSYTGAYLAQAPSLLDGQPLACAFSWQDDMVMFAIANLTPGGGDEIEVYFGYFGIILDVFQNSWATEPLGWTYTDLVVAQVGDAVYVATGGFGNATDLLSIDIGNFTLDEVLAYPSSTTLGIQFFTDPLHDAYYELYFEPAELVAYNATTNLPRWTIDLTGYPAPDLLELAVDPVQGFVYVIDDGPYVDVYNTTDGSYVGTISTFNPVLYLDVDAVHHLLYVSDDPYSGDNVTVLNMSGGSDSVETSFVDDNGVCGLTAVPAVEEVAVIGCSPSPSINETLSLYSGTTSVLIGNVSLYRVVYGNQMTTDARGMLYVPMEGYNNVTLINTTTATFAGNWSLGDVDPYGLAVDDASGLAVIDGDYLTTTLEVIDIATGDVSQTFDLPGPTWGIPAFSSETGTFYSPLWYTGETAFTTLVALPSVPTHLALTPGNTTISASWTGSTAPTGYPVSGYTLLTATSAGGPWTAAATDSGLSTTLTGLTDGTTYYVVVEANGASGTSPASGSASAVPLGIPFPPASIAVSVVGDSRLNVSWHAPAETDGAAVTNYSLSYATSSSGPWTTVSVGAGLAASIGNLAAGTTYYVRVVAWNSVGPSAPSGTATAMTQAAASAQGGGLASSTLWILLVVVIVIAAIVAAVVLRRRRTPPTGAPGAPMPTTPPAAPPSAPAPPSGPPPGAQ